MGHKDRAQVIGMTPSRHHPQIKPGLIIPHNQCARAAGEQDARTARNHLIGFRPAFTTEEQIIHAVEDNHLIMVTLNLIQTGAQGVLDELALGNVTGDSQHAQWLACGVTVQTGVE